MKVTVSGWSAAGSTALALLLAHNYNLRLYQGGTLFRYLFERLDFETTGEDRVESHNAVEPYFGPIFDNYIDLILQDKSYQDIIVESDIASFRLGKRKDIVSIFLHADLETRKGRTKTDERSADAPVLEEVDQNFIDSYKKMYGIQFDDLDEIGTKHAIVIDNSHLAISQELEIVHKYLIANNMVATESTLDFDKLVSIYDEKGKEYFIQLLDKRDLIPSPREILQDIERNFTHEVHTLPGFLRNIIIS